MNAMSAWNGTRAEKRKWAKQKELERMREEWDRAGRPKKCRKGAKPMKIKKRKKNRQKFSQVPEGLVPSSEWFHRLYQSEGLFVSGDKIDLEFAGARGDIVNHFLRYVIEVQPTAIRANSRLARERTNAKLWAAEGYRAFVVFAWHHTSFQLFKEALLDYRKAANNAALQLASQESRLRVAGSTPAPKQSEVSLTKPRTILRKASHNT